MKYNIIDDRELIIKKWPMIAPYLNLELLKTFKDGINQIDDDNYFVKTNYSMRKMNEQFFESHRKYIDIHLILDGEELFAVSPIEDLQVIKNYDESADCLIYDKKLDNSTLMKIKKGNLILFYPNDGHMTALGDMKDNVTKVIFKVKV